MPHRVASHSCHAAVTLRRQAYSARVGDFWSDPAAQIVGKQLMLLKHRQPSLRERGQLRIA
jgi:hypothetical protein